MGLAKAQYWGLISTIYPGHLKTVIWEHASHAETRSRCEGGFSLQSFGLMLCDFFGFPLRIRGGTGSPVRAVALLDWRSSIPARTAAPRW